jgi:hypothetical protein
MREARQAGTAQARIAIRMSRVGTARKMAESSGETSNNRLSR